MAPVLHSTAPRAVGAAIARDSGALVLNTVPSTWSSFATPQRALLVHEEIRYNASWHGRRRYEFDSVGRLVYFAERQHQVDSSTDANQSSARSWIAYAGDRPVLLSRVSPTGVPMRFGGQELRSIAARAYMLRDSAMRVAR